MSAARVEQTADVAADSLVRRLVRGLAKVLLLVMVPLVAAALLIGGSLQIIGVPVWQTTVSYIHRQGVQASTTASAEQSAQSQLKAENANLQKQVASLNNALNAEKTQEEGLKSQLNADNAQLSAKRSALVTAKQEASIVTQMDPAAAAQVLVKLPEAEAGLVLAVLSPGVSSQVLAQMNPTTAAKLLQVAGTTNVNTANSFAP